MNRIKYIFIVILLFLWVTPDFLTAQEPLTLDHCRELAVENNKQLKIAAQTKEKAGYEAQSYRANYLPRFSVSGTYLYTRATMKKTLPGDYLPTFVPDPADPGSLVPNILTEINGRPVFRQYAYFPDLDLNLKLSGTYTAGIRAEQPVYMGGKITAAHRASKIGEEIAGLNQLLTRAEVIARADEAYWTLVKTQELLKTAGKYQELVRELQRTVEEAWRAGMTSQNDVLKVQVRINEAELQLRQARNGVRLAQMNLSHVLGVPLSSTFRLPETFDSSGFQVDYTADISARPEYEMLNKQIDLQQQQIRLARSEFLPEVGVMAGYNYGYGLKLNDDPLLDDFAFSGVVSVKIPVFHWGEGRNKVKSAQAEKRIRQLQRDDLSEKMELELVQALNAYDEAQLEVALTDRSVAQAEESLKMSRDHYEAGLETLANYLEAQTMWQKARSDQVQAKASLKLSETRYLKASGRL